MKRPRGRPARRWRDELEGYYVAEDMLRYMEVYNIYECGACLMPPSPFLMDRYLLTMAFEYSVEGSKPIARMASATLFT